MSRDELYKKLSMLKPFIFQLPNNEYSVIGAGIYRTCNDDEINLYKEYWSEINRLHSLTYAKNKNDVEKAVKLVSEIMEKVDLIYDDSKAMKASEMLSKQLDKMNSEECGSLAYQIQLFREALDYKDNALYRHNSF